MEYCYCVRETTPSDKRAVLRIIDNVYEGLDYLSDYYDYFQNSKHVTSYVYTENEKIIAYVACFRVDNGETMVSRAARVSLAHQGSQVYKRFISQVETLQKEKGLPIYHALLKTKDPSESFLGTYKLVATKAIHMFEYRKSNVSSKLKSHTADYATKTKVIDNIPADFLSPPYSNYLFPEGRVILDWVPFRFLQTNIPLLKGRNTVFISDVAHAVETKSEKENSETDTHQEKPFVDNMQGLLSACTLIRTHHCFDVCCIVDMFGNDIRSLSDHIIVHLQRIHDTDLENINLIIVTSKGACESSLLDKIIEPFEIERVTSGPRKEYCTEQHVYEKEIE